MFRSFKYKINPNYDQKNQLIQFTGGVRWLWNYFLDLNIKSHNETKTFVFYNQMAKQLPELKEEYQWLKDISNYALQQRLIDLDRAIKNCYLEGLGFPKHKIKRHKIDTFRIPQNWSIKKKSKHIKPDKIGLKIPKIPDRIKWNKHRPLQGLFKSITIKQEHDKWYAICLCELNDNEPITEVYENEILGIDLGLKTFAVLSNGREIETQKYYRKSQKKLKLKQRQLSKAKKESKRRNRKKQLVAKIHRKITNQRMDFLHQTSNVIAKHYRVIGVEDLNIKGMVKNRKLSKAIQDQGWGIFGRYLVYKSYMVWVDRWYPSTKTCNVCGSKQNMTLDQRTYICSNCGHNQDRDLNASLNIRDWVINEINRNGTIRIKGQGESSNGTIISNDNGSYDSLIGQKYPTLVG